MFLREQLLDQFCSSVSTLETVCLFDVPFFRRLSRIAIQRAAQEVASQGEYDG